MQSDELNLHHEMKSQEESKILEFLVAIFQDTELFEHSVKLGNYIITFKLPSYSDLREIERLLSEAVINKTVKSKREFLSLKRLYRIVATLKSISLNGKIIFENKIGGVQNRANILSNFLKSEPLFKLLATLSGKFEKRVKQMLEEVTSKDFF